VHAQNFESPQIDTVVFTKVKPFIGADFALQYQSLMHNSDSVKLIPMGAGFNLPSANLTIGADLGPGLKVVLETYLSSRHHNEAWVKGGYLLIDKMPFIKSAAIDKAMDYLTLKIGVMELNYGDAHFRRSDNANVLRNPFVGNYIMDGFTTAPAMEIYFRNKFGIIAMAALSQTSLKPTLVSYNATTQGYNAYFTEKELSTYWKAGIDKQVTEDWRVRFVLSGFEGRHHSLSLYNGDRAGSRYYLIMNPATGSADNVDITKNVTNGYFGPGTVKNLNSYMVNLFSKYKGIEIFGLFENTDGRNVADKTFNFTQYAFEGLYRFGRQEQFNIGARYNHVNDQDDQSTNRIQGIVGWNMTKNILVKLEYVDQKYDKFSLYKGAKAGFNGVMFEAGISF
jgi:hypothetical protein